MYNPTTRLLTILELLQSRGEMSGADLAAALEVEERSVRRYIMMLRDMGIPIDGMPGRHGGYTLQPTFHLPPLMFNVEEVTAITLGLMLIREFGLAELPAVSSTFAKLERVTPEVLLQRAYALRHALTIENIQLGTRAIPNAQMTAFSLAVFEQTCVQIRYQATTGEMTDRLIAPYGILLHAQTWYIPAYCYLRDGMRVFRLDRIRTFEPTKTPFARPAEFDAAEFVLQSLTQMPDRIAYEVVLHAPIDTAREVVRRDMGWLESMGRDTLLRCYTDDPHWLAPYLATLEVAFTVRENEALRAALRGLAERLIRSAED
jgi:predicted DNA-binding transcriptional regulator YafY